MFQIRKIGILVFLLLFLTGCQGQTSNKQDFNSKKQPQEKEAVHDKKDDVQENTIVEQGEQQMKQIIMTMENQDFTITLQQNKTVEALLKQLPMTMTMDDLHGNEKYYYMEQSLPTQSQSVQKIEAGDFMLFGDTCLVVFYQSFSTSYSYTRLGQIDEVEAFVEKMGKGSVQVTLHQ